jgi:exopolysaccharide production protein ExoZ
MGANNTVLASYAPGIRHGPFKTRRVGYNFLRLESAVDRKKKQNSGPCLSQSSAMAMKSNTNAPAHTSKPNERLHSFDFLRGVAVLAVMVAHAALTFPSGIKSLDWACEYGTKGVQLFFLISAFTMCHMWKVRAGEENPIRKFYLRRFFRIAPLFWLAIPTYLVVYGAAASYWAPEGVGARQVFLTFTFLHGFWPDSINSVVPGGWSIAVEMTFYALFPFLIMQFKERGGWYLVAAATVWLCNQMLLKDLTAEFLSAREVAGGAALIKDFLYMNFLNQAPVFLLGCYLYFRLTTPPSKMEWAPLSIFVSRKTSSSSRWSYWARTHTQFI